MSRKSKPLSQQVALVIGGGTGIGGAFALAQAEAGERDVVLEDINIDAR